MEDKMDINEELMIKLDTQISEERKRLSTDKMDISFGELINLYKNDELIIRPEYQRLFRWSNLQKTLLIESILLGIPIPPIFVYEDENGVWELVDGLQRVATIISFFGELKEKNVFSVNVENGSTDEELYNNENNWNMESGNLIKELEGLNINKLPRKYILNIKRSVCRVEIIRDQQQESMKYELFKRLNSCGSKLTAQEIRNAIYRERIPKFNDLLEELSQNDVFKKLTNLSDSKIKERYDQELILRFFAYVDHIDNINSNTELYLDSFMEKLSNEKNFDVKDYKDKFLQVIELIDNIEDKNVFKNNKGAFVPSLYEGIVVGVGQNIELYKRNEYRSELINKIAALKEDTEFKKASGSASNSKNRIKRRLKRANEIFSIQVN